MKKPKYDLVGKRFERLTVIKYITAQERDGYSHSKDSRRWLCLCDCGNYRKFRTEQLTRGKVKSCGCYQKELFKEQVLKNTKHGKKHTRLYRIWNNIKDRCFNPNCKDYFKYGGRGITICEEWRNNFQIFYNWSMANGYSDELSIDRIDNSGNYEPKNCRWTTNKVQCRNRRSNIILEYLGEEKPISQWCEELNFDCKLAYDRHSRGWTPEQIFNTPKRKLSRKKE